jgi:Kef-type K+ transport system membrane component KefB
LQWFGTGYTSLLSLAKFALGMAIIVGIPPLSRRARLPVVVGLLLSGVVLGPHVLGFFGEHAPVANFFAELGKLLLMFFADLEIGIAQFRRERNKSVVFGLVTTLIPLLLGTAVGLLFGYQPIAAIVAVAGLLAQSINLPGIVGAFLAGLAVNAAVRDKPAKEKLEFFGNSFFIPIFFIVTGFLIDPAAFFQSITTNFSLASAVIGALLIGKWIAAQTVGRAFAYTPDARMTMWSLTLP